VRWAVPIPVAGAACGAGVTTGKDKSENESRNKRVLSRAYVYKTLKNCVMCGGLGARVAVRGAGCGQYAIRRFSAPGGEAEAERRARAGQAERELAPRESHLLSSTPQLPASETTFPYGLLQYRKVDETHDLLYGFMKHARNGPQPPTTHLSPSPTGRAPTPS
jgi:hypothetical protein